MSAGLEPLLDGALRGAGGGQMMRQKLGLALDEIREMLLQRRCDPAMQLCYEPETMTGPASGSHETRSSGEMVWGRRPGNGTIVAAPN
jgi:hypothetical protein